MRALRITVLAVAAALAACSGSQTPVVTRPHGGPPHAIGAESGGVRASEMSDDWVTTQEAIRQEVTEEIGDVGLDASQIAVLVDGSSVALSGTVGSEEERDLARLAALDAEGVESVDTDALLVLR